MISAEAKDTAQLGRFIKALKLRVQELGNTGNALPGLFVLEMVRKATRDLEDQRAQATIADFDSKKKEEQTARVLLDSLFRVYTSWERHQMAKAKLTAVLKSAVAKRRRNNPNQPILGAAAMNVDKDGDPLCNYCGKPGHRCGRC